MTTRAANFHAAGFVYLSISVLRPRLIPGQKEFLLGLLMSKACVPQLLFRSSSKASRLVIKRKIVNVRLGRVFFRVTVQFFFFLREWTFLLRLFKFTCVLPCRMLYFSWGLSSRRSWERLLRIPKVYHFTSIIPVRTTAWSVSIRYKFCMECFYFAQFAPRFTCKISGTGTVALAL